jgi:hypothetical protein
VGAAGGSTTGAAVGFGAQAERANVKISKSEAINITFFIFSTPFRFVKLM